MDSRPRATVSFLVSLVTKCAQFAAPIVEWIRTTATTRSSSTETRALVSPAGGQQTGPGSRGRTGTGTGIGVVFGVFALALFALAQAAYQTRVSSNVANAPSNEIDLLLRHHYGKHPPSTKEVLAAVAEAKYHKVDADTAARNKKLKAERKAERIAKRKAAKKERKAAKKAGSQKEFNFNNMTADIVDCNGQRFSGASCSMSTFFPPSITTKPGSPVGCSALLHDGFVCVRCIVQ